MIEVSSLVLFAADLAATVAFYRAVGLEFEHEDHDDGPTHYAAELGPVHFAIYAAETSAGRAPAWRAAGSSFPGFSVTSLDDVLTELRSAGAELLTDHQVRPWGCRFVAATRTAARWRSTSAATARRERPADETRPGAFSLVPSTLTSPGGASATICRGAVSSTGRAKDF